MDDLDSLLEDLGKSKNNISSKKQRPPSSRVDLNELETLMQDLAAPTSKQFPEPTPVIVPATSTNTSKKIDSEIPNSSKINSNDNNSSNINSNIENVSSKDTNSETTSFDDLDALMESLNATSRSSVKRPVSVRPIVAPKQNIPSMNSLLNIDTNQSKSSNSSPNSNTSPSSNSTTPSINSTTPSIKSTTPSIKSTTPSINSTNSPSPSINSTNSPSPSINSTNLPSLNSSVSSSNSNSTASDLDNLLKNLNSQIGNLNFDNPGSRGICAGCGQNILGEVVQGLGKTYHPEHFICGSCHNPLGTNTFYEQGGKPQCETCFQQFFCPRCSHCEKPIVDRCITALGKKWHVEHFICTQCLKPFPGGTFFEHDGRPYCETDFYDLFAPKCAQCHEPIRGNCINALGQQWHPEHFTCSYCQKSFAGGCFFEYGGKPYCEVHYHQQTGSLCGGCGKPISGRCVNALEKKWHPEHFVCAFCMNPLSGGSFSEHNGKAYCRECYSKLFGN
jgi:paxillin